MLENSAVKFGRKIWPENLAGKFSRKIPRKIWPENLTRKLGQKIWLKNVITKNWKIEMHFTY